MANGGPFRVSKIVIKNGKTAFYTNSVILYILSSCLYTVRSVTTSSSCRTHVHKVGEGRWRPLEAAPAVKAEWAGQARPPRVMRIHERSATQCEPCAFAYSRAPPPAAALYGLPLTLLFYQIRSFKNGPFLVLPPCLSGD